MKFGTISLDFKRLSLEATFSVAASYGFDGVELFGTRSHFSPSDFTPEAARRVATLADKHGIEIPMYTPPDIGMPLCTCSPFEAEREDSVRYFCRAVDIAAAIGIPRVLIVADHPGYIVRGRETWANLVGSMRRICRYAGTKGVRMVIEPLTPMESPVVCSADDCIDLIDDVGEDSLYAMMDIVPPTIVREPVSRYFDLLGDRLDYVHICNTDGVTDAHTRLGNGVLPVHDVVRVLKAHGYEGWVTAELYSEMYYDPELMLSNTGRFLRDVCREEGIACRLR